jgi:hypothetical protein
MVTIKKYWYFVVLILAIGIFFYPTLFYGKIPVPTDTLIGLYYPWRDLYSVTNPRGVPYKNFLITDPIRQMIPWKKVVVDQLNDGIKPIWNPYNAFGVPLLGNIQSGAYSPWSILFRFFSFPLAWTILIILQPLLSGVFMYLFLKKKGITQVSSLFGACVWIFSGFSVAWLTWGTIGHVMAWLPLILLSIDSLMEGKSKFNLRIFAWMALLTLGLVMQFVSGHSQMSLYVIASAFFYHIWKARFSGVHLDRWRNLSVQLPVLACVLITVPVWAGSLAITALSSRFLQPSDWHAPGWFVPWQHLVQFVAPDFFGNPATGNYWGTWNYGELVGYIGLVPLLFSLIGLRHVRTYKNGFFAFLLVLATIGMLPSGISALPFVLYTPILSSLQPTRLLGIVVFSLSIFSAFGLEHWIKNKREQLVVPLAIISLVLFLLWSWVTTTGNVIARQNLIYPTLIWIGILIVSLMSKLYRQKKTLYASLCVVLFGTLFFADIFRFGWKFTPFTQANYFFPETKVISFLKSKPKPYRVVSIEDQVSPPNTLSYYGIETPEAYDPILPLRYEEFIAALNRNAPNITPPFGFNRIVTVRNIGSKLFPLLNASYILSTSELNDTQVEKIFEDSFTKVYQYASPLPRVYFASHVRHASSKQDAITIMFSDSFEVTSSAVLEGSTKAPPDVAPGENVVKITSYTGTVIRAQSHNKSPGLLVILNSYYPSWHAYVDGKEVQLLRTNYIFQGILVPEGTHEIELVIK